MFGNNKYMKWLFWGGLAGSGLSLVWRMMDKRRDYRTGEKKYRFVRSLASKTMRGLKQSLADMIGIKSGGQKKTEESEMGSRPQRRLTGSSRWLKESKTKWD